MKQINLEFLDICEVSYKDIRLSYVVSVLAMKCWFFKASVRPLSLKKINLAVITAHIFAFFKIRDLMIFVLLLNHSVQDVWFGVPRDPNNHCQNSLIIHLLQLVWSSNFRT